MHDRSNHLLRLTSSHFNTTTLHVKFPLDWPGWTTKEYTLTSAHSPRSNEESPLTVIVDSETTSDYSSDSPVFRASLITSSKPEVVALKFAFRGDLISYLEEELEVYEGPLSSLQGKTVPRCYGLYTGYREDGEPIACLALEYWGQCIDQPFHCLSLNIRMRILERLREIHRQGLIHGDVAERNVLKMDEDIRIIDFDQAEPHDCECYMDFRPGKTAPDEKDFGCPHLWKLCRSDMRIWD